MPRPSRSRPSTFFPGEELQPIREKRKEYSLELLRDVIWNLKDEQWKRRTGQLAKDLRVSAHPSPGPLRPTDCNALGETKVHLVFTDREMVHRRELSQLALMPRLPEDLTIVQAHPCVPLKTEHTLAQAEPK